MNVPEISLTVPLEVPTSPTVRLRGGWLWAARAVWMGAAAMLVVLLVITLPHFYQDRLQFISTYSPSDPAVLSEGMARLGISAPLYAVYITAINLGVMLVWGGVAALIAWRRSDEWIGLYFSLMLLSLGLSLPTEWLLSADAPRWALWASEFFSSFGYISFFILASLFPDGRFVPRWTRWLVPLWLYTGITTNALPGSILDPNTWGIMGETLLPLLLFLAAFIAPIYRYRHTTDPARRQQIKWVALGFATAVATYLLLFLPTFMFRAFFAQPLVAAIHELISQPVLIGAFSSVPVAALLAMLHYRLWDVDFVINRSLVYGGLTLLLGSIFVGAFFALRALWGALLGPGYEVVAAVLPAVFVALIFNPTRKRLTRFVDRRFYGIKLDYHEIGRPAGMGGGTRRQFGEYTGLELLGRGGMGEVYRGHHTATGQEVAIKILPAQLDDASARRRFAREAQTTARLTHPNIVALHHVGEADGTPYMVMEYVGGQSLSDRVRHQGALPLAEAAPILRDVALALDYAHGQGAIHRDIKPSNVMIEHGAGRVVLMDFGIAKLYSAATQLTQSGLMGTLDYVSPEQIHGASEVDARADVYSLGVMAYQLLAGELPFKHNNPGAMVMAHLMQPPPDPREKAPDLPGSAAQAILRAMAKKPEDRFESAGAFAAALGTPVAV